jgi:ATP-dependent Zn protease
VTGGPIRTECAIRSISDLRSVRPEPAPIIGSTPLLARWCMCPDDLRFPRKLSAYHEAAHAVVAHKLGCTVGHVSITAATVRGGECVHLTPDTYRVPGSRRIRGTPFRQETTQHERMAMALRQRDASTATTALAGVALEDIARAAPALDLLPAIETLNGTTLEGQQLRSRSDIRKAAEAARRQHQTDAGRDQFFRRARTRAARIMLENWPSLTAVAEALLEHGALDGQEVDRLMQAATRRRSNRPG